MNESVDNSHNGHFDMETFTKTGNTPMRMTAAAWYDSKASKRLVNLCLSHIHKNFKVNLTCATLTKLNYIPVKVS